MKKSLLFLGAATIALGAMAATPKEKQHVAAPRQLLDRNVELTGKFNLDLRPSASARKAPLRVNSPEDVITSAEGKRQNMILTGSGYYVWGWWLDIYENQESASHVIYGDNNEVYICDIMPNLPLGTYVKGTLEGNKVTIDLPQSIAWVDEYEETANLTLADYFFDEEMEMDGYMPVEGSLTLTVAEDGTMVAGGLDVEHALSVNYSSDDYWSGYCAWELSLTPFNDEPVAPPSDIEVSEDFFTYKCDPLGYGWTVNFAQGGEEVYFQGLSNDVPDAWVKASVEYDDSEAHVYIDQNQYVGMCEGYYIYTKCAKLLYDEEEDWEYYELMPDDYRFELIWDYESEKMVVKDPSISLLFNTSKNDIYFVGECYEFELIIQESFEGTPVNPTDFSYYDFTDDYGCSVVQFSLPAFSTDGDVLLTDCLSYVVYVDDEQWTFDADEYEIEETLDEIPWNFDSDYISKQYGNSVHAVYIFAEGFTTVGVQSIYRYAGEETRSEIVSINVDGTTGVKDVDAARKVDTVKYFDLTGREVKNPKAGVFVKRVTFSDGTVATSKQAIR